MAITTVQGIAAGLLARSEWFLRNSGIISDGVLNCLAWSSNRPAAVTAPTPGLAGAALTTWAGQIPVPAPVGGENIYLARLEASCNGRVTSVAIWDRLWHNSGLDVVAATTTTVDSVAWPARDLDGSTNGRGVQIALESHTNSIPSGSAWTMSYTNSVGTAGRTSGSVTYGSNDSPGGIRRFPLAAGDAGVRSVQSVTNTGTTQAGTNRMGLVAYRQVVRVGFTISAGGTPSRRGASALELALPRLFDNSVPIILIESSNFTSVDLQLLTQFARG